jgi:hypothetical protein
LFESYLSFPLNLQKDLIYEMSMRVDREPCPFRIVDDAGGAFVFGNILLMLYEELFRVYFLFLQVLLVERFGIFSVELETLRKDNE